MNQDSANSFVKNTIFMMGTQIITWGSSFILMLFLPRYLGSEEYGRLYLAMSIAMILEIVIDFGGQYHITKEVSRSPERTATLLVNSFLMRSLLWLCGMVALYAFALAAGYPSAITKLLLVFGIAKLWEGFGRALRNCYQGREQMQYPSLAAMTERIFLTTVGVAALVLGADALTIAIVMASSTLLGFFISLSFTSRIVAGLPRVDWQLVKQLARQGIPYFLWTTFSVVYFRVDAVMLSLMAPVAVVGWYGVAYRFFDVLMFLPSIYCTAILPILSRLWKDTHLSFAGATAKSLDYLILCAIPTGILVYAFAEDIIQIFFGIPEFEASVILLRIFSLCLPFIYVDFVLGTVLLATDKQQQLSLMSFLAIPLNIGLNYLMIPRFQSAFGNGGIGAALATLVTEVFIFIAGISLLPANAKGKTNLLVLLKGCVAGGIMAGTLWAIHSSDLHWIGQAFASMILYVCTLVATNTLDEREMALIKSRLSFTNLKGLLLSNKGAEL